MSTCRSCHAPIRWARTVAGKGMPLDPEPNPAGNVVLDDQGRAEVLGRDDERPAGRPVYMPHWATCPTRDQHRKAAPGG